VSSISIEVPSISIVATGGFNAINYNFICLIGDIDRWWQFQKWCFFLTSGAFYWFYLVFCLLWILEILAYLLLVYGMFNFISLFVSHYCIIAISTINRLAYQLSGQPAKKFWFFLSAYGVYHLLLLSLFCRSFLILWLKPKANSVSE